MNTLYTRIIQKQITGVPTVPATPSHTDGTWLPTDIYPGELAVNETGNVFTNVSAAIVSIPTVPGTSAPSLVVTESTGTVIKFDNQTIYNTSTAPATGNITDDLTSARLGVVQKIYHNHTVAPTVPGTWKLLGADVYTTSVLNIIYAEWCGGTRVEYWITKEQ